MKSLLKLPQHCAEVPLMANSFVLVVLFFNLTNPIDNIGAVILILARTRRAVQDLVQ